MTDPISPEHMDRWSRNQRLYKTLLGMGLCVIPIPEPDDPSKISQLLVSAGLPPDVTGVGMPMQRAQVSQAVPTAAGDGNNVINFPTIL